MQPIVGESNQSLVEPLIALLHSLHIEVQYEAIDLIKLLMNYNVKDALIKSLVHILKPPKKLEHIKQEETNGKAELQTGVVDLYVQQAAAAKTIGILVFLSNEIAEQFLSVRLNFYLFFFNKKKAPSCS